MLGGVEIVDQRYELLQYRRDIIMLPPTKLNSSGKVRGVNCETTIHKKCNVQLLYDKNIFNLFYT